MDRYGMPPWKVTDAVDFQVSLVGAPSVRIDVSGSDLRLLDASEPWRMDNF